MSLLWSWAAFVSFAFTVSGEHPALRRSLLTRSTTWAVAPDAVVAAFEALGDAAGAGKVFAAGFDPSWDVDHRCSKEAFFHCSWCRPPVFPGPFRQAMAAEGTPTAPMARAAMVICR
ncbi:hypothetical protein [Streptomyces platensis]|uniref:hypothetical protein n=1 Tax=Streptomyces platensis TaxID=58346 RepID=UPI002E80CE03|nr:hypothetical protein [Streptomyces platensis]